jgi:hypothetical protein
MRLPDFIIGGAPRCGTTWLYHLLARHPDVHMAAPVSPEPKFFLVDDVYARGLAHYSATWFAAAAPGKRCGEKSTNYLESAQAAARIRSDLPSVRLVFVLREPAVRAWSNYLWSRMSGMETETFERALELEVEREATLPPARRFSRPHAYFSRGLYANELQKWFALFARGTILCLRFEDIVSGAASVAAKLHRFLDLPARPQDAQGLGPINASEPDTAGLAPQTRARLRSRYAEPNQQLYALLGPGFGTWP